MRRSRLPLALLLLALGPGFSGATALSDGQMRRLERGEVVLLDVLPPGPVGSGAQGGTGMIVVRAAPDAVWRVLVDYAGHPGLYPHVVSADVLQRDGWHALVRYTIGVGPFSFAFHIRNYPDESRGRLVFRLAREQSNDLFRENWGYWQVEGHAAGTLLTYAMASRTVLPAFLTRGAERDGLAETLKAVRQRAERG